MGNRRNTCKKPKEFGNIMLPFPTEIVQSILKAAHQAKPIGEFMLLCSNYEELSERPWVKETSRKSSFAGKISSSAFPPKTQQNDGFIGGCNKQFWFVWRLPSHVLIMVYKNMLLRGFCQFGSLSVALLSSLDHPSNKTIFRHAFVQS